MDRVLPRYPVYVPSKGRFDKCLTAQFLIKDGVPFSLVVEPQEYDQYVARFGAEHVLALPFTGGGTSVPARNWIKDHSIGLGAARHWQLDDNIRQVRRRVQGQRVPCRAGIALAVIEDFVDRYENVALAGMNYTAFVNPTILKPFRLNCHVYSCTLFLNSLPHRWRGIYNEDTDMCLQVLADGWCTIQTQAFMIEKIATLTMKGGNADIYKRDGRLHMARSLARNWPHVVGVTRRFQRAQHKVRHEWMGFDTPLKLKPEYEGRTWEPNEYGMELVPRPGATMRRIGNRGDRSVHSSAKS
jgi:hypothetical protein